MAGRPPKEKLDFAGWETNIFDDPKIDKLMDAQGCVGFTIYFYLCQKAYGSNGYFYPWSCDDAATTARKIGGGVGSESVINTVNLCLRIGLFDNDLYVRHKIITSRGIQKRFATVAKQRTNKSVIAEYWLLEKSDNTEGLVKVAIMQDDNLIMTAHNSIMPTDNYEHNSTVHNNNIYAQNSFAEFWKLYPRKVSKQDAEKAWKQVDATKCFGVIMESLPQFIASQDWRKDEGKYIPYPASWLRAKRWEDETKPTNGINDMPGASKPKRMTY